MNKLLSIKHCIYTDINTLKKVYRWYKSRELVDFNVFNELSEEDKTPYLSYYIHIHGPGFSMDNYVIFEFRLLVKIETYLGFRQELLGNKTL